MARWLLGLILLAWGFSMGLNVGQARMTVLTDQAHREWKEEARLRNDIAESALTILAESKYQIMAAKAEAARRLRNKEDGRR